MTMATEQERAGEIAYAAMFILLVLGSTVGTVRCAFGQRLPTSGVSPNAAMASPPGISLGSVDSGAIRRTRPWKGALIGAGVGMTAGVIVGLSISDTDLTKGEAALAGGVSFGLLGAALGLFIGSFVQTETSDSPRPSLSVTPRLRVGGGGASATLVIPLNWSWTAE